ncbi:MAG: GspH/FimT family pseudopilin [Myxococcota bacterium]|nr:GspH/FimT family pseudopilin [Myxococcota bacterium]HBU49036.1 hypothetical protein [Myxococcales bacterium]
MRRGMTLGEMMTVVALMGVMGSLAVPGFLESRKRSAVNSAARQAMLTLRYARSEAVRRRNNVGISFNRIYNTITVYAIGTPNGREYFRITRHEILKELTTETRRREAAKEWPKGVKIMESEVAGRLPNLPEPYAELDGLPCTFCSSGRIETIFATPRGLFVDINGIPVTGAFSVVPTYPGGEEPSQYNRAIAFNGLTGSTRAYGFNGGMWK